MDIEPIYCSEQITIPTDLADILKAYTKEIIRRQPENLVEFSAKYFQNLVNISASVLQAGAPTMDQLKQLHDRAEGAKTLSSDQVYALSVQLGIAKSIVGKVLAVGGMSGEEVEVDKFLFLLLVMSCDSFSMVLMQLFMLFGKSLDTARFHLFISYLAPHMDPDVTSAFLLNLQKQMEDKTTLEYSDAIELPVIKAKLEAGAVQA